MLTNSFTTSTGTVKTISTAIGLTLDVLPTDVVLPKLFLTTYFVSMSVKADMNAIITLIPVTTKLTRSVSIGANVVATVVINKTCFKSGLSFVSSAAMMTARARGYGVDSGFHIGSLVMMPTTIVMLTVCTIVNVNLRTPASVPRMRCVGMLPCLMMLIATITNVGIVTILAVKALLYNIVNVDYRLLNTTKNCSLFN